MTYFLSMVPMQPPSDILGEDEINRSRFSFNLQSYSRTLPDLPGCVASILSSLLLGTLSSTIFIGTDVVVPSNAGDTGPYIHIRPTGGGPLSFSLSSITTHLSTCQIVIIAADYTAAQTLAAEVYLACVKFNVDIAPI